MEKRFPLFSISGGLAIAILTMASFAFLGALVLPMAAASYSHYQIVANEKRRIAGYTQAALERSSLRNGYEALAGRLASEAQFSVRTEHEGASALLERNLTEIVNTSGAKVIEVNSIAPMEDEVGQRFGCRMALEGRPEAVDTLLESVGSAFPYYYFEEVSLESSEPGGVLFKMEMTVFSYRHPEAS
jgi:type II secretion system (T2SS) protein M